MDTTDERATRTTYSRRRFLGTLGAGAAAVAGGGLAGTSDAAGGTTRALGNVVNASSFTRLFPELPTFAGQSKKVENALRELGRPSGLLDANDQLSTGPVLLITDLCLSANNPNNPNHTAGTTFFGQFIDHDITFDATSRLGRRRTRALPMHGRRRSTSTRSTAPARSPPRSSTTRRQRQAQDGFGGLFEDLPRVDDGARRSSRDPRNDENLIIAGLHARSSTSTTTRSTGFGPRLRGRPHICRARQLTTWHYQWLVLHEFLPLVVGQATVDDVLPEDAVLPSAHGQALIPVEFQTGTTASGTHGPAVLPRQPRGRRRQPVLRDDLRPRGEGQADPVDLRGGARAPRRFIGWQTFFDFGDGNVKPNKRIDTKISTPLFDLPLGAIASHDPPQALPQRNLLRQLTWSLPSGQSVAQAMGVTPLADADLAELRPSASSRARRSGTTCLRRPSSSRTGLISARLADGSSPRC